MTLCPRRCVPLKLVVTRIPVVTGRPGLGLDDLPGCEDSNLVDLILKIKTFLIILF